MNRSTNTAPVSLSTSYLIGSPRIGISTITLQSFGTSLPEGTRSRFMRWGKVREWAGDYTATRGGHGIIGAKMPQCAYPVELAQPRGTPRARQASHVVAWLAWCG